MPLQVQRHGTKRPVDAMMMRVHAMRVSRLIGRSNRKIIFILRFTIEIIPMSSVAVYRFNIDFYLGFNLFLIFFFTSNSVNRILYRTLKIVHPRFIQPRKEFISVKSKFYEKTQHKLWKR